MKNVTNTYFNIISTLEVSKQFLRKILSHLLVDASFQKSSLVDYRIHFAYHVVWAESKNPLGNLFTYHLSSQDRTSDLKKIAKKIKIPHDLPSLRNIPNVSFTEYELSCRKKR